MGISFFAETTQSKSHQENNHEDFDNFRLPFGCDFGSGENRRGAESSAVD